MELVFNHLPPNIKSLSNEVRLFKPTLKRFLLSNSFYSLDEYFDCNLTNVNTTIPDFTYNHMF
jgi:hypothetical protein